MNITKRNLKLFTGALFMTFSSLNNIFAAEPATPDSNPGVENEPIQQEIESVNTQTEKKPSIITPYAGFGLDKKIDIAGKNTTIGIDVSAYIGMKTKFDIDMVEKPVTGDLKLKFSKGIVGAGHKLAIKKAYVNISDFKIGVDKNIFLPSTRYTTAQFAWSKNLTDELSNKVGFETSNNETIFTKSLSTKEWEGVEDVVRWDNEPKGKILKAKGLSDTGWFPMVLVEKIKYDMGVIDTSLALITKPIIYLKEEGEKKKTKFDFGGGFSIDTTIKPIQDITEINLTLAFGRGIGSHLTNAYKYESELVVRDQEDTSANKLVVPWGYTASLGVAQYITPKKISVGLSYLLISGGVEVGKMFKSYKKANKADDEGFTDQKNGWKKLHTLNGNFNWDVNGDERIEFSFGVNFHIAQKNPISIESSFNVNFL